MAHRNDKRKQSLYFPEEMLREIQHEAVRQDRSLSWTIQQAWKLAKDQMSRARAFSETEPLRKV
jgi:uncharacterized small protein (TIGR04563 family)